MRRIKHRAKRNLKRRRLVAGITLHICFGADVRTLRLTGRQMRRFAAVTYDAALDPELTAVFAGALP